MNKKVKIKLTIEIEREVPNDWNDELIDFHFTDKGGENYLVDILEIHVNGGLENSEKVEIEVVKEV